jgi:uncharacterized iron-regulated protein
VCLWLVPALGGCAASRRADVHIPADVRTALPIHRGQDGQRAPWPVLALPIHRGQDGQRAPWPVLMDAIATADVIIIGEEHDDAVGHRVQLAIVEDVLARWPDSALSMEMLDRRKQAVVDDYLADFIGWPDWEHNYQPMIDAAKEAGAPVVAANTPWRVYTSVARKEGFERLDDVTPAQQALFELPEEVSEGRYRERFWETIAGRAEGEEPPPSEEGTEGMGGAHSALTDEQVLQMFRAQLVMDATMADSIAAAALGGGGSAAKVVHLVGHFHCDFEGGLIQELRRRLPEARILVITLLSLDGAELGEDDIGRADFVVHTGYGQPG